MLLGCKKDGNVTAYVETALHHSRQKRFMPSSKHTGGAGKRKLGVFPGLHLGGGRFRLSTGQAWPDQLRAKRLQAARRIENELTSPDYGLLGLEPVESGCEGENAHEA
jgi:hypothetical protein